MSGTHFPADVERRVTLRARKGRIWSAMPLGYQWLQLGDDLADQRSVSERQDTSATAIGNPD